MTEISLPPDNAVEQMCELITALAKADDLGKLIGKQGRTARSLRTILSAAGMKLQHRFSLDVQTEP